MDEWQVLTTSFAHFFMLAIEKVLHAPSLSGCGIQIVGCSLFGHFQSFRISAITSLIFSTSIEYFLSISVSVLLRLFRLEPLLLSESFSSSSSEDEGSSVKWSSFPLKTMLSLSLSSLFRLYRGPLCLRKSFLSSPFENFS
jgi:hypothetical protein